jgi:hypothetical protein
MELGRSELNRHVARLRSYARGTVLVSDALSTALLTSAAEKRVLISD